MLTRISLLLRAAPISCPIHSYLAKSLQEGLGTYMSLVSLLLLPCRRKEKRGGRWDRLSPASPDSLPSPSSTAFPALRNPPQEVSIGWAQAETPVNGPTSVKIEHPKILQPRDEPPSSTGLCYPTAEPVAGSLQKGSLSLQDPTEPKFNYTNPCPEPAAYGVSPGCQTWLDVRTKKGRGTGTSPELGHSSSEMSDRLSRKPPPARGAEAG